MEGKTGLEQGAVWAVGCMSGTSLDGVDAAEILTDGEEIQQIGQGRYRVYSEAERDLLRSALGCWPGEPAIAEVEGLNPDLEAAVRDIDALRLGEFPGDLYARWETLRTDIEHLLDSQR